MFPWLLTLLATIIISGTGVIWVQLHNKIDTATKTNNESFSTNFVHLNERLIKVEAKTNHLISIEEVTQIVKLAVAEIRLEFTKGFGPYQNKKHDIENDLINSELIRKEQLEAFRFVEEARKNAEIMLEKLKQNKNA
jgi:hypothetical protein